MVRPHPDWSDQEHGYKLNDVLVLVHPAYVEHWDGGEHAKVGVDPANANSYAILVEYGGAYGNQKDIARFAEQTDAWTFANALTWYFSAMGGDASMEIDHLQGKSDPYTESWTPDGIIDDTDPIEALRKMAGYRSNALDEELGEHGEDW